MLDDKHLRGFNRFFMDSQLIISSFGLWMSFFLSAFTILFSITFYVTTTEYDRHNYMAYHISKAAKNYSFVTPKKSMNYYTESKQINRFFMGQYSTIKPLSRSVDRINSTVFKSALFGGVLSFILSLLLMKIFKRYHTKKQANSSFIRGAEFVESDVLKKLIKKSNEAGDILLGNVPLPVSLEDRHMAISGDTGTGKSQLIMNMLTHIREREESAIIVDKNGELMQHFYDPDRDIVLAPFDDRTEGWSPFVEGTELFDLERLAKSFIPSSQGQGKDDHWPEASVTVFSWLLYRLSETMEKPSIDDLFEVLTMSENQVIIDELGKEKIVKIRELNELLKGTLAELVIDPDSPEHASSVIASIIPKIRSFWYLRGLENREQFSIRDWVSDEDRKGWVFIRANEDQMDSINPLVTAWIDTSIKATLSLPKSSARKIWMSIDELQSFEKINTLRKGLFEGRKHGLRLILGFTSVNELFPTYGEHSVKAMLSMCSTKLVYRTSEPDAALWNAKLLGEEEVLSEMHGVSYGTSENQSANDQRQKHHVVSYSEIANLPDLSAYLVFSGVWPTTRIKTPYCERRDIASPSVPRVIPKPSRVPREAERAIDEADNIEPLV